MNLLVDTHAVLWFIEQNPKLGHSNQTIIESSENRCFVSIASFWEIAIKFSLQRLEIKNGLNSLFNIIEESGFEILPISIEHILKTANLEFHHQDPFDRLIIAQAISEDLSILTRDKQFANYGINCIW
jgi:PIN domain nuclease of toxin-antitoxin system